MLLFKSSLLMTKLPLHVLAGIPWQWLLWHDRSSRGLMGIQTADPSITQRCCDGIGTVVLQHCNMPFRQKSWAQLLWSDQGVKGCL